MTREKSQTQRVPAMSFHVYDILQGQDALGTKVRSVAAGAWVGQKGYDGVFFG